MVNTKNNWLQVLVSHSEIQSLPLGVETFYSFVGLAAISPKLKSIWIGLVFSQLVFISHSWTYCQLLFVSRHSYYFSRIKELVSLVHSEACSLLLHMRPRQTSLDPANLKCPLFCSTLVYTHPTLRRVHSTGRCQARAVWQQSVKQRAYDCLGG